MNNATLLTLGVIGLLVSLHLIRHSSTALGLPRQLTMAVVRMLL